MHNGTIFKLGIIVTLSLVLAIIVLAYSIERPTINLDEYEECIKRLPDKKLVAEGITSNALFYTKITWSPYKIKTSDLVEFEIQIFDEGKKPVTDITYDFEYKGQRDVGVINDRYVADFGTIPADILPVKINYPCDLTVGIYIDSVGDRSFKRSDPAEIEEKGNTSPVFVQFHFLLE